MINDHKDYHTHRARAAHPTPYIASYGAFDLDQTSIDLIVAPPAPCRAASPSTAGSSNQIPSAHASQRELTEGRHSANSQEAGQGPDRATDVLWRQIIREHRGSEWRLVSPPTTRTNSRRYTAAFASSPRPKQFTRNGQCRKQRYEICSMRARSSASSTVPSIT